MSVQDLNDGEATRMFLASKGVDVPGAEKPAVALPGDNMQLSSFARAFWALVRERNVFRRDSSVWLANECEGRLDFVDPHMLLMWGERHVDFVKKRVDKAADGELQVRVVKRSMPVEAAKCLLAQVRVTPEVLREVERVNAARMPVLREDGRLVLLERGYDAGARTLTFDDGVELEEMSLEVARSVFLEDLREFPLGDGVDGRDRSLAVMVACGLTLFAGGVLKDGALRPMFTFNANAPRSGKTLLVKWLTSAVFGRCTTRTWMENEEEFRKSLDTACATAVPYIFFDNVRHRMESADLEKFVSSSEVAFRPMGKNTEEVTVPNVATVLITANHAGMSQDLAERSLFVNLFVNEADPQARRIQNPMEEGALKAVGQRRRVLSALWAFVRHWDEVGRPSGGTMLAGFEEWSRVIGGMVMAAGFGDPLERAQIKGVGDTDGERMRELVRRMMLMPRESRPDDSGGVEDQWVPVRADRPGAVPWRGFTFGQLCNVCAQHGLFDHWVPETGELRAKERSAFGKYLEKYVGRGRVFTLEMEELVDGVAQVVVKRVKLGTNGESGRARRFIVGEI